MDYLCREFSTYREDLDEIVELMVETVCAKRKTTRIAGSDFPHEVVRSRFLKLDSEHIRFVMDGMQKNTTEVRNMKQYLLAVLFKRAHHDQQSLHRTSQSRYERRRLVNSRFSAARKHREKDFAMKRPLASTLRLPGATASMRTPRTLRPTAVRCTTPGIRPSARCCSCLPSSRTRFPRNTRTGWIWRGITCAGPMCWWSAGHGIDETVKNDIATAERLRITATTLDGILAVKGQGRGKGGACHA